MGRCRGLARVFAALLFVVATSCGRVNYDAASANEDIDAAPEIDAADPIKFDAMEQDSVDALVCNNQFEDDDAAEAATDGGSLAAQFDATGVAI